MRVLTVDDSAVFQGLLSDLIAESPRLSLAGRAFNGREAVEKVIELSPDVVTLDVEMPVLDGLSCLERIMRVRPTPVIMVSSHTRRSSAATIRALQLGALDFVAKPGGPEAAARRALRDELVEKILALAGRAPARPQAAKSSAARRALKGRKPRIVVVGSSTGGAAVVTGIVNELPADMEATVIAVQHMPGVFTAEFARNLGRSALCAVRQAADGDLLVPGRVFVAPGGCQCSVYGNTVRVSPAREGTEGPLPCIDVTMRSVARRFGRDACAVLLTGMGRDGAQGMAAVRDAGGCTIAQDESTSAVFGMPRAAIATGKVDAVLSDGEIRRVVSEMVAREKAGTKKNGMPGRQEHTVLRNEERVLTEEDRRRGQNL